MAQSRLATDPAKTPGAFAGPPAAAPQVVTVTADGTPIVRGNAAPVQTSAPLSDALIAQQLAIARQNEVPLKPLVFDVPDRPRVELPPMRWDPIALTMVPDVAAQAAAAPTPSLIVTLEDSGLRMPAVALDSGAASSPAIILTDAPELPTAPAPTAEPTPALQLPRMNVSAGLRGAVDELLAKHVPSRMPAESNTDSPARGIPQPSLDEGKKITGGFGGAGEAMYFPMDGAELKEVVRGHLSVIDAQLDNDLRFSPALCYPRLTVEVIVRVGAYAVDGPDYDPSFEIVRGTVHDKTPVEVAMEAAKLGQVCFVLVSGHQEMTADGKSITPPNQMRAEVGLAQRVGKMPVMTPGGVALVDLPASWGR